MAGKKTTIYVDDALLKAAKVLAARTGQKEYEVFEETLRGYLGFGTLETIWSRSKLTEVAARPEGSGTAAGGSGRLRATVTPR